jgi:hypothetical protein
VLCRKAVEPESTALRAEAAAEVIVVEQLPNGQCQSGVVFGWAEQARLTVTRLGRAHVARYGSSAEAETLLAAQQYGSPNVHLKPRSSRQYR